MLILFMMSSSATSIKTRRINSLYTVCMQRIPMGIVLMLNLVLMHLRMPTENQPLLNGYCRNSVK